MTRFLEQIVWKVYIFLTDGGNSDVFPRLILFKKS